MIIRGDGIRLYEKGDSWEIWEALYLAQENIKIILEKLDRLDERGNSND